MTTTDYTPTTEDVRNAYANAMHSDEYADDFDAWLARHDAEVRADEAEKWTRKHSRLYVHPAEEISVPSDVELRTAIEQCGGVQLLDLFDLWNEATGVQREAYSESLEEIADWLNASAKKIRAAARGEDTR